MNKLEAYVVKGSIKITKTFVKIVQAESAADAKTKLLQQLGSAGEATIDSVVVQKEQSGRKVYG